MARTIFDELTYSRPFDNYVEGASIKPLADAAENNLNNVYAAQQAVIPKPTLEADTQHHLNRVSQYNKALDALAKSENPLSIRQGLANVSKSFHSDMKGGMGAAEQQSIKEREEQLKHAEDLSKSGKVSDSTIAFEKARADNDFNKTQFGEKAGTERNPITGGYRTYNDKAQIKLHHAIDAPDWMNKIAHFEKDGISTFTNGWSKDQVGDIDVLKKVTIGSVGVDPKRVQVAATNLYDTDRHLNNYHDQISKEQIYNKLKEQGYNDSQAFGYLESPQGLQQVAKIKNAYKDSFINTAIAKYAGKITSKDEDNKIIPKDLLGSGAGLGNADLMTNPKQTVNAGSQPSGIQGTPMKLQDIKNMSITDYYKNLGLTFSPRQSDKYGDVVPELTDKNGNIIDEKNIKELQSQFNILKSNKPDSQKLETLKTLNTPSINQAFGEFNKVNSQIPENQKLPVFLALHNELLDKQSRIPLNGRNLSTTEAGNIKEQVFNKKSINTAYLDGKDITDENGKEVTPTEILEKVKDFGLGDNGDIKDYVSVAQIHPFGTKGGTKISINKPNSSEVYSYTIHNPTNNYAETAEPIKKLNDSKYNQTGVSYITPEEASKVDALQNINVPNGQVIVSKTEYNTQATPNATGKWLVKTNPITKLYYGKVDEKGHVHVLNSFAPLPDLEKVNDIYTEVNGQKNISLDPNVTGSGAFVPKKETGDINTAEEIGRYSRAVEAQKSLGLK